MARKGQPWLAFCLLGLVSLLFLAGEVHNGRLHYYDFEVYYKAGARVVAVETVDRARLRGSDPAVGARDRASCGSCR